MELKDIVLSTLAEIDEDSEEKNISKKEQDQDIDNKSIDFENIYSNITKEEQFLKNLRERILVLFEGFKTPNTQSLEAKLDLTLNFLEYLLSTIDERLNEFKK